MLLKKTLEISLNIKEMLRFICRRQRLHSYNRPFFDISNIQLESEAVRTKTIETRGN